MASDFSRDMEKLMKKSAPYIRKKACLCAVAFVRKAQESFDFLQCGLDIVLEKDKNHGLKLAALTLLLTIVQVEPQRTKKKLRKYTQKFVKLLRELVLSSYDPDYDTSGVTDPFLQVKLLELLKELAIGHSSTAEDIADVLAQVATNTESNK
eukprot:UN24479